MPPLTSPSSPLQIASISLERICIHIWCPSFCGAEREQAKRDYLLVSPWNISNYILSQLLPEKLASYQPASRFLSTFWGQWQILANPQLHTKISWRESHKSLRDNQGTGQVPREGENWLFYMMHRCTTETQVKLSKRGMCSTKNKIKPQKNGEMDINDLPDKSSN